jgi:hypothetical protein
VTVIDALMADEVQHVRFANHWIKRMAERDPTVVLRVAVAMTALKNVNLALKPREGELSANGKPLVRGDTEVFRVSPAERGESGFSAAEVSEVLRLDERERQGPPRSPAERVQHMIEAVQPRGDA